MYNNAQHISAELFMVCLPLLMVIRIINFLVVGLLSVFFCCGNIKLINRRSEHYYMHAEKHSNYYYYYYYLSVTVDDDDFLRAK